MIENRRYSEKLRGMARSSIDVVMKGAVPACLPCEWSGSPRESSHASLSLWWCPTTERPPWSNGIAITREEGTDRLAYHA
jgi:hypothetical protein